jgi:Meiotically up-regulated gene 113
MKDKQFILSEIRRIATKQNGKPPGLDKFRTEAGIGEHEWRGVYWARWSDALREAGFVPLEFVTGSSADEIQEILANLVRKNGKYPTVSELLIEKRSNQAIPGPKSLANKLGPRSVAIKKLYEYCNSREEYSDVCVILAKQIEDETPELANAENGDTNGIAKPTTSGYVYLVKSGKLYKIGCTENHWRRKSELHKQTAEGIVEVHTIAAIDDPTGIEKYWHGRFKDKRLHGEWFDLSAEDVSAFKKRKFM